MSFCNLSKATWTTFVIVFMNCLMNLSMSLLNHSPSLISKSNSIQHVRAPKQSSRISVHQSNKTSLSLSFFCSLKLECEKLATEKTEIQRHYVMVRQTRIHIHNLVLHQMRDTSKHQTPSSFSPQSEVLQTQLIHHREWVFRAAAMCLSAHRYGSYVRLACHLLLADGLTPFLCPFSFSPFFFFFLLGS